MAKSVDNFSDLKELGIDSDVECDSDSLNETFDKAANHLQSLVSSLNEKDLLKSYGYYKQGIEGRCNITKPYWYDFKGKAKWEAWNRLGDMPKYEAKTLYIETVKCLDPSYETAMHTGSKGYWVTVSTLRNETPSDQADKTIIDYVKEGNSEMVAKLLKCSSGGVNELDEDGLAMIHWASDRGEVNILKDLIRFGANVNLKDNEGQTALHYATSCGHAECIRILLSNGSLIDILDNDGVAPVDLSNDESIIRLLS